MDGDERGTLWGLGIGPGDPDLITVKARRLLRSAPVLAYAATESGDSLARSIAAPNLPGGQIEIAIRTPMIAGQFPAAHVYDRYSAEIADHLDAGRDVALVCEGDPFVYGSFMYVYARLAPRYRTVVVPGVSSVGACAAVAGVPLVSRNQVLSLVPAPLPEAELERRIADGDAVVVMKVGRHLAKVRRVLTRVGLAASAHYVERATMESQRIVALDAVGADTAPYFSTILVRRPEAVDR